MHITHLFGITIDPAIFSWVLLPLIIFFARIIDVSLGTIRFVFISRGIRNLSTLIGFFEVFIWIMAISQIMNNVQNIAGYIAYAGGFSAGTYIGMIIEQKLSLGQQVIRVITKKPAESLIEALTIEQFGVTSVEAAGPNGKVHLLFMVIRRNDGKNVIDIIKRYNPLAFYTVEDVRTVKGGNFPQNAIEYNPSWRRMLSPMLKRK